MFAQLGPLSQVAGPAVEVFRAKSAKLHKIVQQKCYSEDQADL